MKKATVWLLVHGSTTIVSLKMSGLQLLRNAQPEDQLFNVLAEC
jgi:hypothetical protein